MRRISVLALAVLLAGCATAPAPSSTASPSAPGSPPASPTAAPTPNAPTPSAFASGVVGRPGALTFQLTITGAVDPATDGFELYADTDPSSMPGTGITFCGPNLAGDTKGEGRCRARTWERAIAGFSAGTILVYRFEHYVILAGAATPTPVQVIASGHHIADGSVIEVTFP